MQVGSVSFGWYSDDEARFIRLYRAASVVKLGSPSSSRCSGGGGMHAETGAQLRRYGG